MPTVFLSSTCMDLSEYRAAVIGVIRKLDGYTCICMEDFGARDWEADDFCRAKVRESDVFVGLLGHYYGSCPKGSERSFTEREYEEALTASKPRLLFLAAEKFPTPANLREPQTKWRKQQALRKRASSERIRETFLQPEELALKVTQALRNHEQERKHVSYAEAEAAYRQHVIEKHGKLTLYSVTSDAPLAVDLERVFVKLTAQQTRYEKAARPFWSYHLPVSESGGKVTYSKEAVASGNLTYLLNTAVPAYGEGQFRHSTRKELPKTEIVVTLTLAEALRPREPLAIIGAPGAGKTTLLKYLALTFARHQAKERLQLDEERLPVFLALRDFNRFLNNRGKQGKLDGLSPALLPQFLQQQTHEHNPRLVLPDDFFAHALDRERCIVLLDGLDEVADPIERGRAAEAVALFARQYAGNRFLVTSRPRGYESEARSRLAALCRECTIRDFDEHDRAEFAKSWYTVVTVDRKGDNDTARAEAQTAADDLLHAIKADDRITQLASNPLLLSILALVHQRGSRLPQRRVDLYEQCVEMLLGYWDQMKEGLAARDLADYGQFDRSEKRALLEPIALWLHERGEAGLEVDAKCLEAQVAAQFRALFRNDEGEARERARLFVRVITERAGLLVEREQGVYAFAHLTFQEYLAARALADREDYVDYTLRHLHDPWWREVILLEVGHISSPNTRRSRELTTKLVRAIRNANSFLEDVLQRDLLLACRAMVDVSQLGLDEELRRHCFDELFNLWRETKFEPQREAVAELFAYASPTSEGARTRDKLVELSLNKTSKMRASALYALGRLGAQAATEEVLTRLLELSHDEVESVRAAAVALLGSLGTVATKDAVLARLLELSCVGDDTWITAVEALAQLCSESPTEATPARIVELSREKGVHALANAAPILGRVDSRARMDAVLPHLLELSRDKNIDVCYCATQALGELGVRAATNAVMTRLLELSRDKNNNIRCCAVHTLGEVGAGALTEAVLSRLAELSQAKHNRMRASAAEALGKLGVQAATDAVLVCLMQLSRDSDADIRYRAAQTLGQLAAKSTPDEVLVRLLELTRDKNDLVRAGAAQVLGKLSFGAATGMVLDSLLELSRDRADLVRFSTAKALSVIGAERLTGAVVTRLLELNRDKNGNVSNAASKALVDLGRATSRDAVLTGLLELTRDDNDSIRASALSGISALCSGMAGPEVLTRLQELCRDKADSVRYRAVAALSDLSFGTAADVVLARLIEFIRDKNGNVRCHAAEALGKLGAVEKDEDLRLQLIRFWQGCLADEELQVYGRNYSRTCDKGFAELQKLAELEAKKPASLPESSRT